MDLSFIRDSFRLRGIKCFIERCFGVGMQIIHHQTKFVYMRIMLINKLLDKVRPVNFFRCSVTLVLRCPAKGSKAMKMFAVPFLLLDPQVFSG